jgi:hypothetical protein
VALLFLERCDPGDCLDDLSRLRSHVDRLALKLVQHQHEGEDAIGRWRPAVNQHELLASYDAETSTSGCRRLEGLDPNGDPELLRHQEYTSHSTHRPRERSALLRRLHHETTELRHDLRALALRALHFTFLPLRDGHDQFEWLLALLAYELVARHGKSLVLSSLLSRDVSVQAEKSDGGGPRLGS